MLKENQYLRVHRLPVSLAFFLEEYKDDRREVRARRSFMLIVPNWKFETSENMAQQLENLLRFMQLELKNVK